MKQNNSSRIYETKYFIYMMLVFILFYYVAVIIHAVTLWIYMHAQLVLDTLRSLW